jgi:hypothetical protein
MSEYEYTFKKYNKDDFVTFYKQAKVRNVFKLRLQ